MTKLTETELKRAMETHEVVSDTGGATDMRMTEAHRALEKRQQKYNAQPTEVNGIKFASKAEAKRYPQLQMMERAGEISNFAIHPRFDLQAAFADAFGQKHRAIRYTADFAYMRDGLQVVEDVKGGKATQDAAFSIRWKLAIKQNPAIKFELIEM